METSHRRILVVDDEAVVRDLVVRVLTKEGYIVDTAENGGVAQEKLAQQNYPLLLVGLGMPVAAQEKLAQQNYSVLLIDIRMPVMGGKALWAFIKEKYPELTECVIFTAGSSIGEDTQDFLKSTGRPRLMKPFHLRELRRIVAEVIESAGE